MKIFLAATNNGMTRAQKAEVIAKYSPKYILETFYEGEKACLEAIKIVGKKNFLLDSGAFSYMNGKQISKNDMDIYVRKYIRFICQYEVPYFFEMDVDKIFGLETVESWRKQIEIQTGKKCIPVWHKQRGVEYWKKMCRNYDYIAIGGLVLGAKKQEYPSYKKLVEYAAIRGIKVHGLGFTKTKILKEYMIKGFSLNDEFLKNNGESPYFEELLARIREIRSSEKVFWRKVLDIYATSIDYNPKDKLSINFFKTVQNKIHFAAHGLTAYI